MVWADIRTVMIGASCQLVAPALRSEAHPLKG
jgi:hypothetical protein